MRHDEPATMMHLIRPLLLLMGVLVLLLVAEHAAGDSVRVHDVSGSDGPAITLAQVAELEGDYARQFADTVVATFADGQSKIEIETSAILEAMRAEGAKLGLLDLKGFGRCMVHRTFTEPAQAQASKEESPVANVDSRATGESVTLHTPTTVRALIEQTIQDRLGIDRASLQITFSDRDEELLRSSAVAGRYEVEPVIEPGLGSVSFKVYAYQGTQRVGNGQVVKAQVAQKVIAVIASEPIKRGELINRRQVRLREVLIDSVQQAYLSDTDLVTGQVASMNVDAGELITAGQVKLPVAVQRRERVTVELHSPGLKITFNGIAKDEGAVGDVIEIENTQTKEVFTATVVGRGKVVAGEKVQEAKQNKEKEAE